LDTLLDNITVSSEYRTSRLNDGVGCCLSVCMFVWLEINDVLIVREKLSNTALCLLRCKRNVSDGVRVNPFISTLKPPQSNGPLLSNTVIGTLAVDRWAVTFGTARRGLGGAAASPGPSSLYQM